MFRIKARFKKITQKKKKKIQENKNKRGALQQISWGTLKIQQTWAE
jgi:hypothetical protein